MPDMKILGQGASFKLPADFSSVDTPFSKLGGLQSPRFLYHVGDMLISIGISHILKNYQDPAVFSYEKLKEGKDFSFDRTAIEKSDMKMVDPASYFLQLRYQEVEWSPTELRKGVQSLLFHGSNVIIELMNNSSTFQMKISDLIHYGLPVPNSEEE